MEKIILGILLHAVVKNGKYLASIIDHSVITCDEITEETKSILINCNEKKMACEKKF